MPTGMLGSGNCTLAHKYMHTRSAYVLIDIPHFVGTHAVHVCTVTFVCVKQSCHLLEELINREL